MFFLIMCNLCELFIFSGGESTLISAFIRGISRLLPHEKAQWVAESWITPLILTHLHLSRAFFTLWDESTVGVFDVPVIFSDLLTALPAPYSILALSESYFGAGMSQTPLAGSRVVGHARRSLVSRRLLVFWSGSDSLFSQDLCLFLPSPLVCYLCVLCVCLFASSFECIAHTLI